MNISLGTTEAILPLIAKHGILISFLGGFITGETVIMSLAFISATGVLPIWHVLIFSTIGLFLSDFIPFTIGRHRWFVKFLWEKKAEHRGKNIEKILHKYTRNNLFLILLITKFIYGASIPALLYLGSKKISYQKFSWTNLFVEIIFVPVIVLVGWTAGRGFSLATNIFVDMRIAMLLLIIFVVLFIFARKWINQKLIKT